MIIPDEGGEGQGSTNWLSRLYEIRKLPFPTETFPWKSCIITQIKGIFDKTSFCHRNKVMKHKNLPWQKQISFTEFFYITVTSFFSTKMSDREEIYFKQQISITETNFYLSCRQRNPLLSQINRFCHRNKFQSPTKVSVRENSFCHRSKLTET